MFDELCTVEAKNWEDAGSASFHEGLEADQVRRMADAVMQKCADAALYFCKWRWKLQICDRRTEW